MGFLCCQSLPQVGPESIERFCPNESICAKRKATRRGEKEKFPGKQGQDYLALFIMAIPVIQFSFDVPFATKAPISRRPRSFRRSSKYFFSLSMLWLADRDRWALNLSISISLVSSLIPLTQRVKSSVQAFFFFQELLMVTPLNNSAFFKNDDFVTKFDGFYFVTDNDSTGAVLPDRLQQLAFGFGVQAGSRFIEDDQGRFDGQELRLFQSELSLPRLNSSHLRIFCVRSPWVC